MKDKGFALIYILVGILVIVGLIATVFIYFKAVKPSLVSETMKELAKKEWVGLIETKKGLVKLSPQGTLEKNSSGVKAFIPPWAKALDEGFAVPRDLLQDGRVVFVGSAEIPSATKENILYSWTVDSSTSPTTLLELSNGQKIRSFAVSPDIKQVAIISVTNTVEEIYEDQNLRDLPTEEGRKIIAERNEQLEQELATISIHNLQKGGLVNTLKLKRVEDRPRESADKLIWKTSGLFVLGRREIILLNSQNGQIIDTIRDEGRTGAGPLGDSILFSPDGLKFFDPIFSTVRKIPGGGIIARIEAPEIVSPERIDETKDLENQIMWAGPRAFSPDSKKLTTSGLSVTHTNFMIWELDIETGQTIKLGDLDTFSPGGVDLSNPDRLKALGMVFFLYDLSYNPSGDQLFFILESHEKERVKEFRLGYLPETYLFKLKPKANKAELLGSNIFPPEPASFLGWYMKNSRK